MASGPVQGSGAEHGVGAVTYRVESMPIDDSAAASRPPIFRWTAHLGQALGFNTDCPQGVGCRSSVVDESEQQMPGIDRPGPTLSGDGLPATTAAEHPG